MVVLDMAGHFNGLNITHTTGGNPKNIQPFFSLFIVGLRLISMLYILMWIYHYGKKLEIFPERKITAQINFIRSKQSITRATVFSCYCYWWCCEMLCGNFRSMRPAKTTNKPPPNIWNRNCCTRKSWTFILLSSWDITSRLPESPPWETVSPRFSYPMIVQYFRIVSHGHLWQLNHIKARCLDRKFLVPGA